MGLVLALVSGCGPATGDLTGKVTYKDRTVICGTVTVVGTDGIPRQGNIEPDGNYVVTGVPAGPVKIGVVSPDPAPQPLPSDLSPEELEKLRNAPGLGETVAAGPPLDRRKWEPLPKHYANPNESGLTHTVQKGPNHHDIRLQ